MADKVIFDTEQTEVTNQARLEWFMIRRLRNGKFRVQARAELGYSDGSGFINHDFVVDQADLTGANLVAALPNVQDMETRILEFMVARGKLPPGTITT